MRKRLLAMLWISVLLGGCSSVDVQPPESPAPLPLDAESETDDAARDLSPSLLYNLLLAEMAAQRGQLSLAASAYYQAALSTNDPHLARRATRLAVYARDFELALQGAELWVYLEKESIEAHQALAALLVGHGRGAEALPHLQKVLGAERSEETYDRIVQTLGRAEDKQQALATMEQLLAQYSHDPEGSYAYAKLAAHTGEMAKAESVLRELLVRQPDMLKARSLLARVLFEQERSDEALAAMHEVLARDPENDAERFRYARMLVELQRLPEAREQYLQLVERQPGNIEVNYALGLIAMQQKAWDEAEQYFLRLLSLGQYHEEAAIGLGQIAEQREQWQDALRWYAQVQGEGRLQIRLREVFVVREIEGGEAALERLRQLSAESSEEEALLARTEAELLEGLGRGEEALARLDLALKELPDNPELLYARAMLGERIDRLDILERDLRAILEMEPDNAMALNALGYTLADRTERTDEALGYIQRAMELSPDDPAVIDSMGWVLYRMGRLEEALQYLEHAAGILDDGEIAAHLGEVLWRLGRQDEARRIWNSAREYETGQKTLQRTLKRFQP